MKGTMSAVMVAVRRRSAWNRRMTFGKRRFCLIWARYSFTWAMLIAVRLLVGSRVGVPLEVKELAVLD